MATTYTTNYNLGKQENHADKFDMDVITDNADKIDAALTAKADKSTTYTKTEVDTALSGKQATLTTAQLDAVNSGITSADVTQIGVNKNNILSNQNSGFLQKNLFLPTKQSDSYDGAVITDRSDGTYTITSTSQTTQSFVFTLGQFTGDSGKTYYVSGCPISSDYIALKVGNNYYGEEIATYVGTGSAVNVTIRILPGFFTDTPLVFKPMISESNDDSFVPYSMSNAELTEMVRIDTALANNDDLNNCLGYGKIWYSASSGMSATIINTPFTGGGFSVYNAQITNRTANLFYQYLIPNNEVSTLCYRRKVENAGGTYIFGSWYKFSGTVVS